MLTNFRFPLGALEKVLFISEAALGGFIRTYWAGILEVYGLSQGNMKI